MADDDEQLARHQAAPRERPALLQAALVLFALGFFAEAGALWMIILKGILPQLLLNLLAACLLLKAASWLQRRFAPRFRVPGLRGVGRHYGS